MSTRPRKGSSALSHVSNHSSNNSSGSAKYSERSAMTTVSSRNTNRKLVTTSSGPLSSSPLLDSRKSSSVYDEILKTAFKKKKPIPNSASTTTSTSTTTNSSTPSSTSTGLKSKTSLTPTKRNSLKDSSSSKPISGLKTLPSKNSGPTTTTGVETGQQSKEAPQQDSSNVSDQQQIPTRDTTEHKEPNTQIEHPPGESHQPEDQDVKETLEQTQEIPSKLEEEEINEEKEVESEQEEPPVVEEKPVIDISKISALIETEKELLNHTVINNNISKSTVPSTPSERIASLTEEEKIKVKNLAARNLKYNNYEELFESPKHDEPIEDIMDNTIVNNISVIETKEEPNQTEAIKEHVSLGEVEGESTPVSMPNESNQFPQMFMVEETPIVEKELDTSTDSDSSFNSYLESDVVVFESPNKDEREVRPFSPIQKDEVMEPMEMNESFNTTATEKLEAHLQKTVELEKENELLKLEIKFLEKELTSNHHHKQEEEIDSEQDQVVHTVIEKPKYVDMERDERPYFEDSESEEEEEEEPVQEVVRLHTRRQPEIIEISREELIKPRAFMNHQILFQEVKKELKRNIQEIKPIKIPEVFIRETTKPKQEIKIIASPLQEPEPENEIEIEEEPIIVEPVKFIVQEPTIVHQPVLHQPVIQPQIQVVEKVDEDLEFEMELQKIVGEDFRRKKANIMNDSQAFVERGATSPIARLRRRVQNNVEEVSSTLNTQPIVETVKPSAQSSLEEQPIKPSTHRLAGYKARRDARMKLLEKQEISITLLSNDNASAMVINEAPREQERPQSTSNIPVKPETPNESIKQPTRSRTSSINSERVQSTVVVNNSISDEPVKEKPSSTVIVQKENIVSEEAFVKERSLRRNSEKKEEPTTVVESVQEVKTSRKKFEEVIIISPPRNPPPVVHHIDPLIQIDQETVDAIVPEDNEKVVLLKKTEALLNKSRERHSSPNRKIEITRETESPSVSFVTSANYNNQSLNQSTSVNKEDPKQETLNRVNHLEKFVKDLKKKKQDELDVVEKKFDEMKSYFSQELGTRDSEIHNLTNQNKLLRDKLAVAQSQIDDLSIVIEHILETQEVLEVQLKKKPKVNNKLTSPLIEAREDEPVSPVSYPGNDIQNNLSSPVSAHATRTLEDPQLEENHPTPLAFSKEDINVDLSIDGEFYLSIGKASLPLGEYLKTL